MYSQYCISNNNCTSSVTATAAVTSDYNGSQVSCTGASDGKITVTASGGTGALSYLLVQIPGNVRASQAVSSQGTCRNIYNEGQRSKRM